MTRPASGRPDSTSPRRSTLGDLAYGERFEKGAPDVSPPRYGWGLIGPAVLLVIGTLTPWAYVRSDVVHRTDIGVDISWSAPVGAAVIAALGVLIVARRGQLWVSVGALTLSAIFLVITMITAVWLPTDEGNKYQPDQGVPPDVTVAYGVWLAIAGLFGATIFAVFGLIKRTASPAKRQRRG